MRFTGIDAITYGVEDLETSIRFLTDWGLSRRPDGPADGALFETMDGSEVVLRPADAPDLPPAMEPGPTLRRVTWGVADEAALAEVAEAVGTDPADPNGLGLAFRVTKRRPVAASGSPINTIDQHPRVDTRSPVYERAEPVRIGHVVLFTGDVMASVEFYTGTLGFKVSDSYPGAGYFLRCRAVGGHHDLFLLQRPDGRPGLNHVAFAVRDIHEIFGGGIHMNAKGWRTQIGPGRHPISSAYFWYVHNPCGGLAEYYSNEDFCTEAWQPKDWERSAANFAEWSVSGGIDAATRRQVPKDAS